MTNVSSKKEMFQAFYLAKVKKQLLFVEDLIGYYKFYLFNKYISNIKKQSKLWNISRLYLSKETKRYEFTKNNEIIK